MLAQLTHPFATKMRGRAPGLRSAFAPGRFVCANKLHGSSLTRCAGGERRSRVNFRQLAWPERGRRRLRSATSLRSLHGSPRRSVGGVCKRSRERLSRNRRVPRLSGLFLPRLLWRPFEGNNSRSERLAIERGTPQVSVGRRGRLDICCPQGSASLAPQLGEPLSRQRHWICATSSMSVRSGTGRMVPGRHSLSLRSRGG